MASFTECDDALPTVIIFGHVSVAKMWPMYCSSGLLPLLTVFWLLLVFLFALSWPLYRSFFYPYLVCIFILFFLSLQYCWHLVVVYFEEKLLNDCVIPQFGQGSPSMLTKQTDFTVIQGNGYVAKTPFYR